MKDLTGTFPEKYTVGMEAGLIPCEVETGICFSRSMGDNAVIGSNDPLVVSRLLTSAFFVLENWRGVSKRGKMEINYVDGLVPIGSVTVSKPRANNGISLVVKSPRKNFTEDEVIENKKRISERLGEKRNSKGKQKKEHNT